MANKILTLLLIASTLVGAVVAYANMAYFPMDRGVALEGQVISLQSDINKKLDILVARNQ